MTDETKDRLSELIKKHELRANALELSGSFNIASEEYYLIEYLRLLQNILAAGDCNECLNQKTCKYVPKPGQQVRYNCPFYNQEGGAAE